MPDIGFISQINDSKKLTHNKRKEIFNKLIDFSTPGLNQKVFFGV